MTRQARRTDGGTEGADGNALAERDGDSGPQEGEPVKGAGMPGLTDRQFQDLLAFRTALRRFERWSAQRAQQEGLTPAQHQLLLAVRGHPDPRGPTIGQVADYLLVRHHSVVGLVDRVAAAGLVERERGDPDGRVVRLRLTRRGKARIRALTHLHLDELRQLARLLEHL